MKRKFEVCKAGWENENPFIPLVLIDGKLRKELETEKGQLVKVNNGANRSLAIVEIQFWEFVGTEKVTLNSKLQNLIDVNIGEKVEIDTDVKEDEKKAFLEQFLPPLPQDFLRSLLSRGQ